jgi:UPF0176 protein
MFILYYLYVPITDVEKDCADQTALCESLSLLGRIRISQEGINGTLSGLESNLNQYMIYTEEKYGPIHWKTSDCLPTKPRENQLFSELSVKQTKEVVSLDLSEGDNLITKSTETGTHLSPEEFHAALEEGSLNKQTGTDSDTSNIVLIDVRNIYETRIGLFQAPHVSTIDPLTRKVLIANI